MLCVHSLIEILPHDLEEIANRRHHPLQVIFANETLVDADDWSFVALRVRTDVGEEMLCAQLLVSHPRHPVDYVARRNRRFRPCR